MKDTLHNLVDDAAFYAQGGHSKEFFESLTLLSDANPSNLLNELFLQVEETAAQVALDKLQPTVLVPDVDFARKIVSAVREQNVALLRNTVEGDYPELVIALVSVISLLKTST